MPSSPASARVASIVAARFAELVGTPPLAYLTELRLSTAADRLLEPGATIGAVAHEVGYSTPYALSAAFKRVRGGASPKAYRGRLRLSGEAADTAGRELSRPAAGQPAPARCSDTGRSRASSSSVIRCSAVYISSERSASGAALTSTSMASRSSDRGRMVSRLDDPLPGAVERDPEPEHSCQQAHAPLIRLCQRLEFGVSGLGLALAVVPRDLGDQFDLTVGEADQLVGVADHVIRVPVVGSVGDEETHVVEQPCRLQQVAIRGP